jgi:hypothetical protein
MDCKCVYWIDLTQDTDKLRAIVDVVMKFHVSQNAGI